MYLGCVCSTAVGCLLLTQRDSTGTTNTEPADPPLYRAAVDGRWYLESGCGLSDIGESQGVVYSVVFIEIHYTAVVNQGMSAVYNFSFVNLTKNVAHNV